MISQRLAYHGDTGQTTARFRPASEPPGYRTAKGTTGHYLAAPADTGGQFSLYRWDMSPDSGGPGPHFHRTYDETFYILAGTIRLYDGTRWLDAFPGDMLYVPAGGIHGFTNTSGAPASMLMLLTPGADRAAYFTELAAIAASGRELSDAEWAEVFVRHDNVMLSGDERTS
jgi:mannose-6-phosphate isomerase-like protein (cupin superfamily)